METDSKLTKKTPISKAMEAYLLHDANAGSNLKLMIMIQEEGMKGYGHLLDSARIPQIAE